MRRGIDAAYHHGSPAQTANGTFVVALRSRRPAAAGDRLVPGARWTLVSSRTGSMSRGDPIARRRSRSKSAAVLPVAERAQVQAEIAIQCRADRRAGIDVEAHRSCWPRAARRDNRRLCSDAGAAGRGAGEAQPDRHPVKSPVHQLVRASRDGRVQQLATSISALVSPGTVLAVIAPERRVRWNFMSTDATYR
jgi:multidrug resistance efflux pump